MEYEISLSLPINYAEYIHLANLDERRFIKMTRFYSTGNGGQRKTLQEHSNGQVDIIYETKKCLMQKKFNILYDYDLLEFKYTECSEIGGNDNNNCDYTHVQKMFYYLTPTSFLPTVKNIRYGLDKQLNNDEVFYFIKVEMEFNWRITQYADYAKLLWQHVIHNNNNLNKIAYFNCLNFNFLDLLKDLEIDKFSRKFSDIQPNCIQQLDTTIKTSKFVSYKLDGQRCIGLLQDKQCTILPYGHKFVHTMPLKFKYICFVECLSNNVFCIIDILYTINIKFQKIIKNKVSVLESINMLNNLHLPSIVMKRGGGGGLYKNQYWPIDMIESVINYKSINTKIDGILFYKPKEIVKYKLVSSIDLIIDVYNFIKNELSETFSHTNFTQINNGGGGGNCDNLCKYCYLSNNGKFIEFIKYYSDWKINLPSTLENFVITKSNGRILQNFVTAEFNIDYFKKELNFKMLRNKPNCNSLSIIKKLLEQKK